MFCLIPKILQLKKENPGTVLMVEVGYKFRFFGDDAKV
jgi:DNA mismatch repair protein MSH3